MEKVGKNALSEAVKGTIFAEDIQVYEEIDSTNSAAMLAAQSGAAEGSVFLADRQTAGRGRGGNTWNSEPGAIYLSVVLRPRVQASDVLVLSLATGLAVSAAVEELCGVRPDLRWPNDVMLSEKKLGGILCELSLDAGKVKHAVIGIGLNVNQPSFPAEIRELATSLLVETGKEWSRTELVSAILRQLDAEYSEMQASPENAMRACIPRFESRSSYARGKRVKVAESDGFEGITDGLDAHGFLRVRRGAEVRTVISGGVRPA